jgi:hypothetical protein
MKRRNNPVEQPPEGTVQIPENRHLTSKKRQNDLIGSTFDISDEETD